MGKFPISSAAIFLPLIFFSFLFSSAVATSYEVISVDNLKNYNELSLPKVVGPESIAFDCLGGGPYVGVSDGRILKWEGKSRDWREFAFTAPNRTRAICDGSIDPEMESICGRPLGLKFNSVTCELYIADAYFGLLKVGPQGGAAQQLATSAGGKPFMLTNALDIDTDTGVVYFVDSSTVYQRRDYMQILEKGDRTGRLLTYDDRSKNVNVLLDGLWFPNGVALSKDKSFILVVITNELRILKYWLSGPKTNTLDPFAQLLRFPDNIKANDVGDFWVGFNDGRSEENHQMTVTRENFDVGGIPWFRGDPVAIKYREDGSVAAMVDGRFGTKFGTVTEIMEHQGNFWIGSLTKPYVATFKA